MSKTERKNGVTIPFRSFLPTVDCRSGQVGGLSWEENLPKNKSQNNRMHELSIGDENLVQRPRAEGGGLKKDHH